MSPATVIRAVLLYLFLIFVTRIVGRRPGKQITPFEFVLIFYLGGLCLTAMVGAEASLTNAVAQIVTIALAHFAVTHARMASPAIARLLDGTPLILLEGGTWRAETMRRMRIGDADVMNMARDQGLKTLNDIDTATLERNGEISIIPKEDEEEDPMPDDKASADKDKPRPVADTVPKVDNAVAVGEDLAFQRRWWKFENIVWSFFALILLADLSGLLGNGPLAHVKRATPDQLLEVAYDRVERATTPVKFVVKPGPAAIHNGRLQLFVSDTLVKDLGAATIAPQPAESAIGNGGITYTFPALPGPAEIQFGLLPPSSGLKHFTVGIPGGQQITEPVLVLP